MKAIIELLNGRTVDTDNIKCPICGGKMKYDRKHSYVPEVKTYIESMPRPFEGLLTKQRTEYTSFFACPNDCCGFELKHFIDELIM